MQCKNIYICLKKQNDFFIITNFLNMVNIYLHMQSSIGKIKNIRLNLSHVHCWKTILPWVVLTPPRSFEFVVTRYNLFYFKSCVFCLIYVIKGKPFNGLKGLEALSIDTCIFDINQQFGENKQYLIKLKIVVQDGGRYSSHFLILRWNHISKFSDLNESKAISKPSWNNV